ncbi:hypothetical protein BDW74DRAFT_189132 [Aspergillus multicolor]|uniref:ATP-grasp enzyme fsqD n=1 Tax=Aspergillus multicolor TaxID=41759 RepID=UPI003CCDE280
MAQTGRIKACYGNIEAHFAFRWQVSSAEWWQSVDITFQAEHSTPAQISSAAPEGIAQLWYSTSSESVSWTELELGHATALLHRALQAATNSLHVSAIRFVFAPKPGYLVRSDIFSLRMVDLDVVDAVVSFFAASPEKLFTPLPIDPTTDTILQAVLYNAIGGLLLQPLSEDTKLEDYADIFHEIGGELTNRLSFPWMLDAAAPHKTIAIVEGGRSSPEHGGTATSIYQAAQALNFDMIVLDVAGHWLEGPQYAHWRREFVPVELEPQSLLKDRIVDVLSGRQVDGIVTFCDAYQVPVAQAAIQLGLPTFPVEAYEIATDKYLTGISEGRPAHLVHSYEEALDIVQRGGLQYPFIVKPCKGFLSEGVFKVQSAEELTHAIRSVNLDRHGAEFVLEEYCDGPEVDINFILSNAEILFCDISDDFPKTADVASTGSGSNSTQPTQTSFIELGNVLPSKLPPSELDLLRDSLHASLTRLGLTTGIYHLEARVQNSSMEYATIASNPPTKSKIIDLIPRLSVLSEPPSAWLIEINPRPPGIQETAAVECTYGIDYWGIGLLACLRDHARLSALAHPFASGPQYWCEMVFIPVTSGGRFDSDDVCVDLMQRRPDLARHISRSFCFLRRGDVVPDPESGITSWVAYYVAFSRVGRAHLLALTGEIRRETTFTVV